MIDPQLLRKDIAAVAKRLATRKFQLDVEKFNTLEAERKSLQTHTEELQAKRLLASFDRYRARNENAGLSITESAKKWFLEVFEPITDRVPESMRGRVERAQMFHEILENRWYLSEQKGTDVGLEFAADNYVQEILPYRLDSGVDVITQ
jgi:seryl-tRNA synthetase